MGIVINDGLRTDTGSPYLLGANLFPDGCNFAVFSKNATEVNLLLFDGVDSKKTAHKLRLDHKRNRTGDIWHIFVYGIEHGQLYGYTVDGPYSPMEEGHRFNVNKLLIDPYTKAVCGSFQWNDKTVLGYDYNSEKSDLSFSNESNFDSVPKSTVVDTRYYDWEDDKQLNIPFCDTVIYELHIRAFTVGTGSGVSQNGTYKGLIEKIPYLKELGVTTVELLPVHVFNELENTRINPVTGERLVNFFGYSSIAFFAPEDWYSSGKNGIDAVVEFKEMVKAFHKAGLEIILDVVYNHTGEGSENGPTISFRGLDNSIYYMLDGGRFYKNYSGCGNTMNCNHPVVKRLIIDSLRYWVVDMHVDGFRFDLAAILGRDSTGEWFPDYSILSEISEDPILSNTKIIAESWDAAGLYTVGKFPEGWAEWNGKFRDDVRSFVKSDPGRTGDLAQRLCGSIDLFSGETKSPFNSINIVTTHDGFTLNDVVSYNGKHNEHNAENNMDGDGCNFSWNCGVEGNTSDKEILKLRDRQMRNLFAILMISQGTPMVYSGDEIKFSKQGNNNTYCHDNGFNWIDWGLLEKNRGFFEFCRYMIKFRKDHPVLRQKKFILLQEYYARLNAEPEEKEELAEAAKMEKMNFVLKDEILKNKSVGIRWHGVKPDNPDWSHDSHSLALTLYGKRYGDTDIYAAFNSYWKDLGFELPGNSSGKSWHIAVDTFSKKPFFESGFEPAIPGKSLKVNARSLAILIEK
jgi:isoamylase